MAERTTAKVRASETAKSPAKAGAKTAGSGGLSAENARLKAELAGALERVADLEMKQADIVSRIDRVIDSLHRLEK
ncbi:MAG: hypothetical protein ABL897_06240 [Hyphomicrobium sp.]